MGSQVMIMRESIEMNWLDRQTGSQMMNWLDPK